MTSLHSSCQFCLRTLPRTPALEPCRWTLRGLWGHWQDCPKAPLGQVQAPCLLSASLTNDKCIVFFFFFFPWSTVDLQYYISFRCTNSMMIHYFCRLYSILSYYKIMASISCAVNNRGWDGWMASQLNGHEFEWTPGDSEGQRSLLCCNPWGCRVRYHLAAERQPNSG